MLKLIRNSRSFAVHGASFDALAAPSTGSRETSAWFVTLAPGTSGMAHSVTREEIFVALEGVARFRSGAESWELREGSALVVPPEVEFWVENHSSAPFRAVTVMPVGGQAVLPDGSVLSPPWAN